MPTKMLPQCLLRNFIGILRRTCQTGKCTPPASSHGAGFNPVRTKHGFRLLHLMQHSWVRRQLAIGLKDLGSLTIDWCPLPPWIWSGVKSGDHYKQLTFSQLNNEMPPPPPPLFKNQAEDRIKSCHQTHTGHGECKRDTKKEKPLSTQWEVEKEHGSRYFWEKNLAWVTWISSSDLGPSVAQPAMRETCVWSLGQEDPLKKEMATHSIILAWEIPWTEESLAGYSPWGHKEATQLKPRARAHTHPQGKGPTSRGSTW